jgi:hypothetical protein
MLAASPLQTQGSESIYWCLPLWSAGKFSTHDIVISPQFAIPDLKYMVDVIEILIELPDWPY